MIEELDLKILKSIVSDKVNALTFSAKYDQSLFDSDVKRFGKLILDYISHFRSPPTKRTLIDRHKGNQDLVQMIEESWQEMEDLEYDIREFPYDLGELKKRFQLRAVDDIRAKAEVEDIDNLENPEEYFKNLSMAITRVTSMSLERTHTQKTVGDYVDDFKEAYESKRQNPESDTEDIKTGYSIVDAVRGGISNGELIIIGGESASGKSMVLNNISKQIWMQKNTIDTPSEDFVRGYNVLYFSLEMPYKDCFNRLLASLANISSKKIKKAQLSETDVTKMNKALDFIKRYQEAGCHFDIVDVPRGVTIQEIELRYHDALSKYHPDVVVVDYLGLMNSLEFAKEADWLKLGAIASSLHEFARAYDCPLITAAQLTDIKRNSQGSQDESKTVGMHRFGRSSLIIHNVNLAIQIETRAHEKSLPDMKIHIIKDRRDILCQGNLIKNFANALLIDMPIDQGEIPGEITQSIPDLIKSIQAAKNKPKEN